MWKIIIAKCLVLLVYFPVCISDEYMNRNGLNKGCKDTKIRCFVSIFLLESSKIVEDIKGYGLIHQSQRFLCVTLKLQSQLPCLYVIRYFKTFQSTMSNI